MTTTTETANAWIDSLIAALLESNFVRAKDVYDSMPHIQIRSRACCGLTLIGLKYNEIRPESVSRKVAGLVHGLNQFRAKVPAWLEACPCDTRIGQR